MSMGSVRNRERLICPIFPYVLGRAEELQRPRETDTTDAAEHSAASVVLSSTKAAWEGAGGRPSSAQKRSRSTSPGGHICQRIGDPPSTGLVCPWMKEASSLARKQTARAISIVAPYRPAGVCKIGRASCRER